VVTSGVVTYPRLVFRTPTRATVPQLVQKQVRDQLAGVRRSNRAPTVRTTAVHASTFDTHIGQYNEKVKKSTKAATIHDATMITPPIAGSFT
jgi:hypothetical protein